MKETITKGQVQQQIDRIPDSHASLRNDLSTMLRVLDDRETVLEWIKKSFSGYGANGMLLPLS